MGIVVELRRSTVPKDLYDLVSSFIKGQKRSLFIIAHDKDIGIEHYSFGDVPEKLAEMSVNRTDNREKPCAVQSK